MHLISEITNTHINVMQAQELAEVETWKWKQHLISHNRYITLLYSFALQIQNYHATTLLLFVSVANIINNSLMPNLAKWRERSFAILTCSLMTQSPFLLSSYNMDILRYSDFIYDTFSLCDSILNTARSVSKQTD